MNDDWLRRLDRLEGEFLFNERSEPPFKEWTSRRVGRFWLHTHPDTPIGQFGSGETAVHVIGPIVASDDSAFDQDHCPPGQFVAFSANRAFSDAGSLKQAFFDRQHRQIASSLRLLGGETGQAVRPELMHGSRPDWYWGPRTSFARFDFLLPSQFLDLESFEPQFRTLPDPNVGSAIDPVDYVASELSESFRRLNDEGRTICLAMTGGLDSRTLFAAALRSGVPFETYTMASRHVHPGDVASARLIALRHDVPHRVLEVSTVDQAELDWYLWYSGGESVALDADFHAAGLWRCFDSNAIHIRGLGFELGRHKYRDFLTSDDRHLIRDNPSALWRKFTRPWIRPLHRYNREAFATYMNWVAETLDLGTLDFRDRLYLEQGIGTWCASSEYALAATGSARVSLANRSDFYNLFVREGEGSKKSGPLQRAIMRQVDPGLLDIDFVKPTRRERLRYRAIDTLRALRIRRRLASLR